MSIENFIQKIEEEFDELKPGVLSPDSNYRECINWSSMNALVFIIIIESEFDVILTDDDFENVSTVKDLYHYILQRKKANV